MALRVDLDMRPPVLTSRGRVVVDVELESGAILPAGTLGRIFSRVEDAVGFRWSDSDGNHAMAIAASKVEDLGYDPAEEREARLEFKIAVLATDRGCVVHEDESECEGDFHAHHVVTQQELRKAGRDDLLWDPRNGATVCELVHRRHHRVIQRIPFERLPERCVRFAAEYGLEDVLAKHYPRIG